MGSKLLVIAGATVLAIVLASCGGDGGTSEDDGNGQRTIEIDALDELAFEPSSIDVETGETVRFVVTNVGHLSHEFVVGDEAMQDMAEEQAMGGMHGHVEAMASLTLDPGETSEIHVTFEEPGELLYACHVEGHYAGGMVGTITVT